jgi:hypothetical protein
MASVVPSLGIVARGTCTALQLQAVRPALAHVMLRDSLQVLTSGASG